MSSTESKLIQCPVERREIRNVSGNTIRVSSEHRLSIEEIYQAISLAESITSMQDPAQIFSAFADHIARGTGTLEALKRAISSLVVRDIQNNNNIYLPNDRVHKLISDAGGSCANVTAFNCGIYDYIEGEEESLDNFFTNNVTEKARPDTVNGKTVLSTCVAPQLGRKWVQAATEAILMYDPTIVPKFTTHETKA